MTFDSWKYHPDNLPPINEGRNEYLQSVEDDFHQNIRPKQGQESFFAGYTDTARDFFTEEYVRARQKAVLNAGETLRHIEGPREMRYRPETERVYDMILQKKLFNLQCLWRAEQAEVAEVWMTIHFHYWGRHIRECPFIEPVTGAEIMAMQAFLLDDNYEDTTRSWLDDWQDYHEMREKDEFDDFPNLPEWYEFYDASLGTSYLLGLPDVRGTKETTYRRPSWQKAHEQNEAAKAAREAQGIVPEPYKSSYCPASTEMLYAFAREFDDPYFRAIFKHLWDEDRRKTEQEEGYDVEAYIEALQDAEVPPIIAGGVNWREALKRTAQGYKNSILAEDLELMHNEYSLLQIVAPKPSAADLQAIYDADPLVAFTRDQILDGRAGMGEPRDFDF